MFHYSHPNAFFQPHLHPRGCSREYLLGLGCQGCSGACSTPFSIVLQPSVRSVVDLEVMMFGRHLSHILRFVGVSHFQLGSIQSVLLSVSQGDWLASFDLREAYIPVTVPPTSRPFLRFLLRDTVYQFQALCFGLSTAPQVFTWVMAPVSAIIHSLVSVCVDTSTPGWSSLPLRSLSSRFFYLSSDFVQILGLSSIPGIPTSYLPR